MGRASVSGLICESAAAQTPESTRRTPVGLSRLFRFPSRRLRLAETERAAHFERGGDALRLVGDAFRDARRGGVFAFGDRFDAKGLQKDLDVASATIMFPVDKDARQDDALDGSALDPADNIALRRRFSTGEIFASHVGDGEEFVVVLHRFCFLGLGRFDVSLAVAPVAVGVDS